MMNEFEIWVYRGLIAALLAALIFWLRRFVISVDELKSIVEKMQLQQAVSSTACEQKHLGIDARLNAHSKEINGLTHKVEIHSENLAVLNSKAI